MAGDDVDHPFRLLVPAGAEHMTTVRTFAGAVARHFGCEEDVVEDVKLAVSEACAAPIDARVPGTIELRARVEEDGVVYEVTSAAFDEQPPGPVEPWADRAALVRALFADADRHDGRDRVVTRFSTRSHAATRV